MILDYNRVMNVLPIQTSPGEVLIPLTYFDDSAELEMFVRDGYAIVRSKEHSSAFHANEQRTVMLAEVAAFGQQHSWLAENYLGEYVAFMNGELIDHDVDHFALRQRIDANFQDQVVLLRQVKESLPQPIRGSFRFRS